MQDFTTLQIPSEQNIAGTLLKLKKIILLGKEIKLGITIVKKTNYQLENVVKLLLQRILRK